jgi:hypothetical protein
MQQVGGALGLAMLSTVSLHFVDNRQGTLVPQLSEQATALGLRPADVSGQA